ncbi:LysR family transcriptional regulator [Avibacterium sp. 21-594]|nr:LysR family transcriptional regulator [Avibacterium sp. 21-594]
MFSFVKAGQLLGISSSALSHSMKNLEMRLEENILHLKKGLFLVYTYLY